MAGPGKSSADRRKGRETEALVEAAFAFARKLGIRKIVVQASGSLYSRHIERQRKQEEIVWLVSRAEDLSFLGEKGSQVVSMPDTNLSRMSLFKLGLMMAVLNGNIAIDERVVCLSGLGRTGRLDTLFVTSPRRDFPWLKKSSVKEMHTLRAVRELARVIDIALHLAAEGREGRPIGTILVLGEPDRLERYLRQLVLNPCAGHPQRERNIHKPEFLETIREFAALDGAFVINSKGVVLSAGTYLEAPAKRRRLPPGLGARHAAALSITAATDAVATVVSSSSGKVTVFLEGRVILELEKPEPLVAS